MPDWLAGMFSRVVGTKTALPLFIASALILFVPDHLSQKLGMQGLREEYALPLGLLFVFSASMLAGNAILSMWGILRPSVRDWVFVRANRGVLKNLTEAEKEALRPYILDGEAEQTFRLGDGVVNLLVGKKVLKRAANLAVFYDQFHYFMQPWARQYLERNKHLLD